ncbi:MAG: carboxypeptidase regulatory-like domain-containing protein [Bacteroidota bacterium]
MKLKKLFGLWAILFVAFTFLAAITPAKALPPRPPQQFFIDSVRMDGGFVMFKWKPNPEGDTAHFFTLYKALGRTEDRTKFHPIWNSLGKDSLIKHENGFWITKIPMEHGEFSFFMTATNPSGESERTYIIFRMFGENNQNVITFTSIPVLTGSINQPYTYDVDAVTNPEKPIKYVLMHKPDGMTIDENTGLITWTPTISGKFEISVKAYLVENPAINKLQNFVITIVKCPTYTGIDGTVHYENGEPVLSGTVEVYRKTDADPPKMVLVTSKRFEHGIYRIPLEEGTFYLHFVGETFQSEWYNNKYEMPEADPVEIQCGDSLFIPIVVGPKAEQIKITFSSHPKVDAFVNEPYEYDADATASNGGTLKYALVHPPDGMTIDEDTGLISWIPLVSGRFEVGVKAYLADTPTIFNIQAFVIQVRSCRSFTGISGTVSDQNGQPIAFGNAEIYRKVNDTATAHPVFVAKIERGNFRAFLDEGTYIIRFSGDLFMPEWWQDAHEKADATPITIACGDSMVVIASVEARKAEQTYIVKGRVTDADNNTPIPYASIVYFAKSKHGNEVKAFRTWANESGNYEISLSDRFLYLAYCFYYDSTGQNTTQYIPQYYDGVYNPTEATIIELTGNLNDINFALNIAPELPNGFSGIVQTPDSLPIPEAHLVIYRVGPGPWHGENFLFISRATIADEGGNFSFEHLIPGNYVVFAFTREREYIPGYYRVKSIVIPAWHEATRVPIAEDANDIYIHVVMTKKRGFLGGNGRIGGKIKGVGGEIKGINDNTLGATAIKGAVIYLYDSQNELIDYAFSDQTGQFDIYDLTSGNYKLQADRVGFFTKTTDITVANDSAVASNDFDLLADTDYLPVNEENATAFSPNVYPNPASESINIDLGTASGITTVEIVNSLGIEQFRSTYQGAKFNLNVKEMPSGVYFVKITNGANTKTVSFRIIR